MTAKRDYTMSGWMRAIDQATRPDWSTAAHYDRLDRMGEEGREEMALAFERIGRLDIAAEFQP